MKRRKLLAMAVILIMVQLLGFTTFLETGYAQQDYTVSYSPCSEGTGKTAFNRGATNTSELNPNQFKGLKNSGVIDAGRSGSNRPLTSTPNSYYTTSGGHALIYDTQGKLIYDIDPTRVKGFQTNINPAGQEFYNPFKLEGAVPDFIKTMLGW